MQLEVTWDRAVRIWWAYAWRNLIAIVVSLILNVIIGFIVTFVFTIVGAPRDIVVFFTLPLGCAIGLIISIVPVKMILGKDFGEFQLVLMAKSQRSDVAASAPSPPIDSSDRVYVRPDGD